MADLMENVDLKLLMRNSGPIYHQKNQTPPDANE
jgi:hypothetical protein